MKTPSALLLLTLLLAACATENTAPSRYSAQLAPIAPSSPPEPSFNNGMVDDSDPKIDVNAKTAEYRSEVASRMEPYRAVAGAVLLSGAAVAKQGLDKAGEGMTRITAEQHQRDAQAMDQGAYKCPKCGGYGRVDPGGLSISFETCPRCDGTGWLRDGRSYKPVR
ncbi:hypothetical protein [Prosthecobacter sp.]|uniref:hypothetical protein n=1 Tax=Prosthecobacter sp. TaxID=1965333 RepID=UPI00378525B9